MNKTRWWRKRTLGNYYWSFMVEIQEKMKYHEEAEENSDNKDVMGTKWANDITWNYMSSVDICMPTISKNKLLIFKYLIKCIILILKFENRTECLIDWLSKCVFYCQL